MKNAFDALQAELNDPRFEVNMPGRNVTAMHMKQKSKKIAHKNERRSKDARKSWKNEDNT